MNVYWAKASILLFLFTMVLSHSVFDLKYRLDDDLLYSYTSALSIAETEVYQAEQEHLYDYAENLSESREDSVIRLKFRENYNQNYFLSNITILAMRPFIKSQTPLEHIQNTNVIVTLGGALAGIVVILLSAGALRHIKSKYILVPLIAALSFNAVFIVFEFLHLMKIPYYRFGDNDLIKFILRGGKFFLMPGEDFNLHATRARNIANLLILSIFILRCNGNIVLSYVLCFCVMALHVTYGILVTSIFMLIDMALRPQQLKKKSIVVLILAISALGALNSAVWSALSASSSTVVFLPLILLGVSFVTPMVNTVRGLLYFDKASDDTRFSFEIGLVFIGTAIACLISFICFHLMGDNPLHTYTTAELAPRITSMMRLPLIFGGFYLVYKHYIVHRQPPKLLPLSCLTMLFLGFGLLSLALTRPNTYISEHAELILEHTYERCPGSRSESVMYSFLACRIDGLCTEQSWNIFDKCKKLS